MGAHSLLLFERRVSRGSLSVVWWRLRAGLEEGCPSAMGSCSAVTNPVIPGFYPDPSVCRRGDDDYYLVTSTFEYFPGLPIFHSRDLVRWRKVGHALDRWEQLDGYDFGSMPDSGGIYAPTIRYHDTLDQFFIVTTIVSSLGPPAYTTQHIVLTANNPAGPWSAPRRIPDAPGIDPSLFIDASDDRVWFCANQMPAAGERHPGHREIWLQEFNVQTLELFGPRYTIWDGASKTALACEAPHIYAKDGSFYLVTAEGGTGLEHAVVVARSDKVTGPYLGHPGNPFLTHRHLGKDYPITGTGHADWIEASNGEWWMVLLAMRPYGGYYYNLGRETFLARVLWDGQVGEGWPRVLGGTVPVGEPPCQEDDPVGASNLEWNTVRVPDPKTCPAGSFWCMDEKTKCMRLNLRPETLYDATGCPSYVARRQCHMSFVVTTGLRFSGGEGECAGLALRQSSAFNVVLVATREGDGYSAAVWTCERPQRNAPAQRKQVARWLAVDGPSCHLLLQIRAVGQDYTLSWRSADEPEGSSRNVTVDGRILSTTRAGGFVGTYVGLYASSNGQPSQTVAEFPSFHYTPAECR